MNVNPNSLMPQQAGYQQPAVAVASVAPAAADGGNVQGQGLIRRVKEGINICGGPM